MVSPQTWIRHSQWNLQRAYTYTCSGSAAQRPIKMWLRCDVFDPNTCHSTQFVIWYCIFCDWWKTPYRILISMWGVCVCVVLCVFKCIVCWRIVFLFTLIQSHCISLLFLNVGYVWHITSLQEDSLLYISTTSSRYYIYMHYIQ